MASNRDIAVVVRRRRQLARQFSRRCMYPLAEALIENGALLETGFFLRRESVLVPQARRRGVPVLAIPIARHLLVMIVKLGMSTLIVLLLPVLGKSHGAR